VPARPLNGITLVGAKMPKLTKLARWRAWVQQGPIRFILIIGVLAWGVPVAILTPLAVLAAFGELVLLARVYQFSLPAGLAAGCAFGALMWRKVQQARAAGVDTVGRQHRTD